MTGAMAQVLLLARWGLVGENMGQMPSLRKDPCVLGSTGWVELGAFCTPWMGPAFWVPMVLDGQSFRKLPTFLGSQHKLS